MIFGKLLASWRLRRANRLIARQEFDAAQALLIEILDNRSEQVRLLKVYAALVETEFRRSNFLNSRYYARMFLECYEALPAESIANGDYSALFDRVDWCIREGENASANPRRKVLAREGGESGPEYARNPD